MTCSQIAAMAKDDIFVTEERPLVTLKGGTTIKGPFLQGRAGVNNISLSSGCKYLKVKLKDNKSRLFDTNSLERIVTTNKKERIYPVNDGYLTLRGGSLSFFSGEQHLVWSAKSGSIVYLNEEKNVVVGYADDSNSTGRNGRVVAYKLSTGEELWRHAFPQKDHRAWMHPYSNGDTLYLVGDKLYQVNVESGKTFSYPFETTKSMSSKAFFTQGVWYPTNEHCLSEVFCSTPSMGQIGGTHSNPKMSGDSLFIADANNLYCFNSELQPIWKTPLPDEHGSLSSLTFTKDGNLCLLSYGIAFQALKTSKSGKPFCAIYDRQTGKELSLFQVPSKKMLRDARYFDGRIYWQYTNNFYYTDEGKDSFTMIKGDTYSTDEIMSATPNFVILKGVGFLGDSVMNVIPSDETHLVAKKQGRDIIVFKGEGVEKTLPTQKAFFTVSLELWENDTPLPNKLYAIVHPITHKVLLSFSCQGKAKMACNGDLWIYNEEGFGVIRKEQISPFINK